MVVKLVAGRLGVALLGALIAAGTTRAAWAQAGDQASLFPVQKDGKSGYIDRTGRVVIALQFDGAQAFSDGLALAQRGCHPAYIDRTGKVIFELGCEFNIARPFSEGLAVVGKRGPGDAIQETLGFIDKTGKVVIPLQFDEAGPLTEGLARVSVNLLRGYINSTGTFVIKPQYGEAGDFSGGLARVGNRVGGLPREHFIDHTGARAIRQDFRFIDDFHEGLARVWIGDQKGFIDRTGALAIKPQPFDDADFFSDGLARVQTGGLMGQGGKHGFIDRTGKIVVPATYDFTGNFSEGLCNVSIGGKWGYIDKTGKVIIQPIFGTAEPFHNGLAAVWVGNNDMRYIDKAGKYVWGPVE